MSSLYCLKTITILLITILLFISNIYTISYNNYEQQVLSETSYFPAKIETLRIARLPGMNYSIRFYEVALIGNYYFGVEELDRIVVVDYNFVIMSTNGDVIVNRTLARIPREKPKPKYNLITYRDMAVLIDIDKKNIYYAYGLFTQNPVVKQIDLRGENVVYYLTIDRYIILFTESKIYCLWLETIITGDRDSSFNILDGYLSENTLYVLTYSSEVILIRNKTIYGYKVYVETYNLDLQFNKLVKNSTTTIGYTSVLNKYIAEFTPTSLVFINNIYNVVAKYNLSDLNIVINQIFIESPVFVFGFVINNYVVIIHGYNNTRYVDIYNGDFNLIYRASFPYLIDLSNIGNLEIHSGLENKYVVTFINITNKYYIFAAIDLKYGLLNVFQYNSLSTNETITRFQLINKGSLILIQTVNIYSKNVSNIYLLSIDFKYVKKISNVYKLYCVCDRGYETVLLYDRLYVFTKTRITGTSVVIVLGVPSIITYSNYGNITNTMFIINTPSIFNIEAGRFGVKCIPLRGYTGPTEIYGYVDLVFENNKLYYLNTTEFSAILVVKGRSANIVFKDQYTGLTFSIEFYGNISTYYLPPSSYEVEIYEGPRIVGKTNILLEKNSVFVLDTNEIIQNSLNKEGSIIQFIMENIIYVLIGLVLFLFILLIIGLISIRRG